MEKGRHLRWGLVLFSLNALVYSTHVSIVRLCSALKPSQTMALMFVGEVVVLLPFSGIIWRRWSVSDPKAWAAFCLLGLLVAMFHVAAIFCTQHMNLG